MTYDEAKVRWIRQVEGRIAPEVGETACYWPDVDLTDMLVRVDVLSLDDATRAKLFGNYRTLCGDEYTPEIR